MHRDTVTRSWGPLWCHSSAAMFQHGNARPQDTTICKKSWKLKQCQFFHGLHTHQTCHPLTMFGMLWIDMYGSVFQFPTNIQQLRTAIEEEWDNIPQATINSLINSMWRRCVALHETNSGHNRILSVFLSTLFSKVSVTNRCISAFPVMWNS